MSTVKVLSPDILSKESRSKIDHWLTKYPADQKQSAVIASLFILQEENGGFLTTELMDALALYLEMPKIAVYEVATFYCMYDLNPVGRHKIYVCTNVSCMLCGSDKIVDYLKEKLKVGFGETTEDGKFTLKEAECLAACDSAPMMLIGRQYYANLTPEKIDAILDSLE